MAAGWLPSWGSAPDPEPEPEDTGPPGYVFPPYVVRPTKILNGCPRCHGEVIFSHREHSKWCKSCDRAIYTCSEDTLILHVRREEFRTGTYLAAILKPDTAA